MPSRAFFGVSTALFAASVVGTIVWCGPMAASADLEWCAPVISWAGRPELFQAGAVVSFLGMWGVMMIAMMLPCLMPMLWRYRQALGAVPPRQLDGLTARVGAAYFFVWTGTGVVVRGLELGSVAAGLRWPVVATAVPLGGGLVVAIAGLLQFTPWKRRHLEFCRDASLGRGAFAADVGHAWRHGLRLGLHCVHSCAGLTAVLAIVGAMDLRVMAAVTGAIIAERLLPAGEKIARLSGGVIVVVGVLMIARTAGLR